MMSQQGRLLRNFLRQLIRFLQEKQANKQRQKQNNNKEKKAVF